MATDAHPELPIDADRIGRAARRLHTQPLSIVLVYVGGAVGTLARYRLAVAYPGPTGGWPAATFAVNLVGAFILGVFLEELARAGSDQGWRQRMRLLVGTGFCGGFTTYSTFAVEIALLVRAHHPGVAGLYGLATVIVGLLASAAGIAVATGHHRWRRARTRS